MAFKYLLVGNPNTGKTTLFNTLTRSHEKTGNYSGVTTTEKENVCRRAGKEFAFVDLPGVYSFSSESEDEKLTKNCLAKNKDGQIIYVCSSRDIKKNLILLDELRKQNEKLMIIINKFKSGLSEDVVDSISKNLDVPVLQANVKKDGDKILDWLSSNVAKSINSNINLDKLFSLIPTSPTILKSIDKFLLNPVCGKMFFIFVFAGIIVLCYGSIGQALSSYLNALLQRVGVWCAGWIDKVGFPPLTNFWWTVIVGGVGSVLVYLPQLAMMLTILFLLEDMGYLPRVGNLFNYNLEKLGMNGKSVFSMIMGVGCTTSAILTTRNVGAKTKRDRTVRILPFIGCSAKFPILLFVCGALLGGGGVVYAIMVFLLAFFVGVVYLRVMAPQKNENYFISELPKLKAPSLVDALKQSFLIVLDLLKKIFLTVFLSSAILWLLLGISPTMNFFSGEKSLLEYACDVLSVIFKPLGLGEGKIFISLISGLIAKENILSSLGIFGGVGSLNVVQGLTFLIFVALHSPCFPALKCAKCEFGKIFAFRWFFVQTLIAYCCAFIFSTFAKIWIPLGFIVLVLFGFLLILMKKYTFKRKNTATNFAKSV